MQVLEQLTVVSVKEALVVPSEKGRKLNMVDRARYGLSFCTSGEIIYTHNGRRIVSDPGCAVLLPMGATYHLEGSKSGAFPLINFTCLNAPIRDFLVFPVHTPEPYLRDFEAMRELILLGHGRLKQLSLLYGIFSRLERETADRNDVFAPIVSFLESNYADPRLSNTLLAEQGSISEVYMRQLFRERLGTSPKQYILELRMQKAKQMLGESNATVSEVAAACGFTAIYHFCRAFKAFVGQTPTDYRRDHKKMLI